jgi:tetratricopeptide (TPR) repeat protein
MGEPHGEWRDGDELAEEARRHLEDGRLAEAEAALRQALVRNPDRPEWHFHLGRLLEQTDRAREAREEYLRCHELDPGAPEPLLAAASVEEDIGDTASAIRFVEKAVALDRECDESHAHRIRLLAAAGRHDEARDAFYEAQEFVDSPAFSMIAMASGLEEQGDLARAAWCYREALRHDPSMHGARTVYARCLAAQGEHPKALQNFMHVLREEPGSIDALLGCAETLASMGRESDAAEKLRRIVEIEPANVPAHHMLGALELRAARFDRAAVEFELVLKLAPDRGLVRLDLADAQFRRGKLREARETMRTLLADGLPDAPDSDSRFATRPEHERTRALRSWSAILARTGALLAALREWDAAAKVIPAFVKIHANEPDAWRALARARYESKDIDGGREASLEALKLDPACALSHHNLALAALRTNDLATAADWVRRGLKVARADEGLRRLRSRVLLARLRALLRRAGWRRG